MKTMKLNRIINLMLMVFFVAFTNSGAEMKDTVRFIKCEVLPDTIVKTDTIIVKEVVTRTDVIHRTEKVVRYEEKIIGVSDESIENGEKVFTEKTVIQRPAYLEGSVATVIPDTAYRTHDGNFIWVPDSMENSVKELLLGKSHIIKDWKDQKKQNNDEENINPYEKVTFRGDTISMILKDRNLGRYDRGLFNYLFIPKGIWQIGLTASYGEFSTEDLQILDLVSDIDFYGHIFSVRPYFAYFFKSNVSLGLRLGYTEGKAKIGSFKVDVDEDINFNLHDIMYRSQNYSAAVTLSQYLGITRKGRFGIFNEVELAFAGGSSDFHRPYNGELRKTHTSVFEAGLNFSPGVCVYVLEQVSFNVSFGVFGLNIKHEKQTVNDEPMGHRTTSGANFRFNIFNINFGIAVNI